MKKWFQKLYSEYLLIPRAVRLLFLWGWIILLWYLVLKYFSIFS
ncbi:Uncharacterised protein [Chlamydia abortus]|uniref:Uncharacterized protein n=1 Tax=Paenibacillus residui TaxID=629724 RepID=A0ABW3DH96_9BACL|nr:Uncharacterised protein [Chlamydia abortus]